MDPVRFDCNGHNSPAYGCSKPGDNSGDYYRVADVKSELKRLRFELLMVSKMAADEPMFFNPISAAYAKSIRDRVLANSGDYL